MIKGYQYRLKPNHKQIDIINQTFGCVRKMWNTLLFERESIFELFGEHKELLQSHKYMNPKYIKEQFPYMYDVDSQALTTTWLYLKTAYNNFFNKTHEAPRYKSRHNPIQSYTTHQTNNNIRIEGSYIKLPKLGYVRFNYHRTLPKDSFIKAATIKREAGKYYVSLRIESKDKVVIDSNFKRSIGLDYTLHGLYTDSMGNSAAYPDYYKQSLDKLKKESRILSRRHKGSKNYLEQKQKLSKLHQHIKNQRKDFLHKASRNLVNDYEVISIETLDLTEMAKTKHFRKSISDTAYHMFTKFLEYKLKDEGKTLIKINKYYPSSKTCSVCGKIHDIPLSQRTYTCTCGNYMDRDHNAAINIGIQGLIEYSKQAYGTDVLSLAN